MLFAVDERSAFSWKSFLRAAACAMTLLAIPLRGQDDNGAVPPVPPSDNGAPVSDAANGAPEDSASFQTFYDSLGSQGTWIQSGDYGYVWQPQVDDPDWAPYTAGHWVYTDDGWTWVSDEPWGWATYHYGRWVNLDGTGWCWVPGYTWAPAWVSWRYGDGYAGWAPLPPDSFVGVDYAGDDSSMDVGYHIGSDCDDYYGIGPGLYIFLPVNFLCYRDYRGHYGHRGDNFWRINHTSNVTNINFTRNGGGAGGRPRHVSAGGPELAQVNAVSQTPIQKVSIVHTNQPGGGTLAGNSLQIYAPRVSPGATGKPAQIGTSLGQGKINRGVDIGQPLMVNPHLSPPAATPEEIEQARLARSQAPAGAKVLTDNTSFKPLLQAPVTSLKPIVAQATQSHTFNANPSAATRQPGISQTQFSTAPTRTYPQTSVQENGAPTHGYNSAPVYPSGPSTFPPPSHTTSAGGAGSGESHVLERPSAPVTSAPVAHESSSSSGSSSGRTESGGSASGSTQSTTSSGSGNAQLSGGSSSAGSGGGPPSRNH